MPALQRYWWAARPGGEGNGLLEWSREVEPVATAIIIIVSIYAGCPKKVVNRILRAPPDTSNFDLLGNETYETYYLLLITYYNVRSSQCCLSPWCSESELGHCTSKHCQRHNGPEIYIRREQDQTQGD